MSADPVWVCVAKLTIFYESTPLYHNYLQNKPLELIGGHTGTLRIGGKRKEDSRSENPLFSTRTRDIDMKTHENE